MKIFLNERSIPEKSSEPQKVFLALAELTQIAATAKKLCNNQHIRRHRELKNKDVLDGKSLQEYIIELAKDLDPQKRKLRSIFLELFAKGPFLTGFHREADQITDSNGGCLKSSCFDDAIASSTGAAVLSVEPSNQPTEDYFHVTSSVYGSRRILNISNAEKASNMPWIYESNAKHDIPKDFLVDGETHSAMTLSAEEAQRVLSNGIKIGKSVFSKVDNQWYKFHCHGKNFYHGFPITVKTPYKDFSAAKKILGHIENKDGQLLEELLNFPNKA